jgi:hypothetical protein
MLKNAMRECAAGLYRLQAESRIADILSGSTK